MTRSMPLVQLSSRHLDFQDRQRKPEESQLLLREGVVGSWEFILIHGPGL